MSHSDITDERELSRLRWQCRRGMLELDVLLNRYLEGLYLSFPEEKKQLFQKLLSFNDQDLFTWLSGNGLPPEKDVAEMVQEIRRYAQTGSIH